MFEMTTADKVGLYIGAWGMANAISRLLGSMLGGALRDLVAKLSGDVAFSYVAVFSLMAAIMLISLGMLRKVDVVAFRQQVQETLPLVERAAAAGDSG